MCHVDEHWAEVLPLVLLGIRSARKQNLKAASAELVFGSPLRKPGDFFVPSPVEYTNIPDFASRLRVHIGKLRSVLASRHAVPSTLIFKDLTTSSHVFVRQGALRVALQAPYVGPYRVFHCSNKTYTIEVHGAASKVSIDRLKPALCPTC
jgi:hypothetical protein